MTINGAVRPGDYFAFYGLLKQGAKGMPDHIDLGGAGDFLGPCRVIGELYDLGGFPGLVRGDSLCHAVLYQINDVGIIPDLDAYERVRPRDDSEPLYQRLKGHVLDDVGKPTGDQAWIYWYSSSVSGRPLIENGNWPLDRGWSQGK